MKTVIRWHDMTTPEDELLGNASICITSFNPGVIKNGTYNGPITREQDVLDFFFATWFDGVNKGWFVKLHYETGSLDIVTWHIHHPYADIGKSILGSYGIWYSHQNKMMLHKYTCMRFFQKHFWYPTITPTEKKKPTETSTRKTNFSQLHRSAKSTFGLVNYYPIGSMRDIFKFIHLSASSTWPCLDPSVTFSRLKWPPFGESKGHFE